MHPASDLYSTQQPLAHSLNVATAAEELGHEGPLRVNGEVRDFLPVSGKELTTELKTQVQQTATVL